MRFTISTLTLAAAATALPSQHARTTTTSTSKGFNLVAHVTDATSDLTPSVEGLFLSTAHTGAGLNAAVLSAANGRLFYQNGTTAEDSDILTDGGTPLFPFSLQVQPAGEARRILDISVGQGTAGSVDAQGRLVNGLGAGAFLACRQVVPYYNQEFITLQYVYGDADPAGLEGCATIELVAKCAELNELPEGSLSSHEFAAEVKCE
ncbi:hypothetical protein C8A01DRAFT_18669 [Parachaetomium inaequale]|uniref:DUF7907 domain-containing protein n=1 Tax=Parachaetomium inaequale TaxID=2588326 RepID=A0AAN6SP94_9PEZI|nr:hypothetical protein C8A01DRAFT_18669 [Parachaetomium inaequale]